jgi:hypothetical protein
MSVEQHFHPTPQGHDGQSTYFVGRRQFEAPEVYALTSSNVKRLESSRRYGEPELDWQGSSAARMELGHLLITRVAGQRPSGELLTRFAVYVLSELSDDGFVMDSEEIWNWLVVETDEEDFLADEPGHRTWAGRLRALWPGGSTDNTDA